MNMKENIKDYVKIFKKAISPQLCKKVIKDINNNKKHWQEHYYSDPVKKNKITRSGKYEFSITYLETANTMSVTKKLWPLLKTYIADLNFPWFNSWDGYTAIRWNIYNQKEKMQSHCDHIHTMFDGNRKGIPTLAILGVLNDNYDGGEFKMFEDTIYKLKTGDVIIFPSIFLYPHKVLPVKKGKRYSYVSWVW